MTSSPLALTLPFKTLYFFNIFCMGLNKDLKNFLDMSSRGVFLHLSASKARAILGKIIGHISYTSIHDELPEKEKKSSPEQEEKVLIAKS
jgi:hypothetical protein